MTPEGSFKPMVMFFSLTNSPVTFQVMMNKLLRDLINMGKVAAFIDNVIVGTEDEKGYDMLVAKIIKRLEKKFVCKVREVQVESKRGRVFGSCDRTRWDKDRRREDERCFELANTEVC